MADPVSLKFTLNGKPVETTVAPRLSLADYLRDEHGLKATRLGCEMGTCGACLVMMDATPAHACLVLAAQADGAEITTLEGLTDQGVLADLQAAFVDRNAAQCGFCTSGMLMSALAYIRAGGTPDRAAIRDALSGNFCRCTGYEAIVDAISEVAGATFQKEAAE